MDTRIKFKGLENPNALFTWTQNEIIQSCRAPWTKLDVEKHWFYTCSGFVFLQTSREKELYLCLCCQHSNKNFPQYLLLIFSCTQNKPVPGFRSCCFAHIAQHYQMGSRLISVWQGKYPFTQNIKYKLNVKGKFLCSVWRQSDGPLCSDSRSGCETDCLSALWWGRSSGKAHWEPHNSWFTIKQQSLQQH